MSHELYRLTERLYGTPLLADQQTIKSVIGYLEDRNSGQADLRKPAPEKRYGESNLSLGEVGVATLNVSGPLSYDMSFIEAVCGGGELSSYESIDSSMDEVVASGNINTLAVIYNTGGGEARGSFASARRLRELADAHGIHLISFIEGGCNSAGYVLGCTAHEIIMMDDNATSVGSIGALIALKNDIPKEMKEGSEVLFISAGDEKVPFDNNGRFKQEFLTDLQESVDLLREDFISHVAAFRDMTEQQVSDTQAKSYQPAKALELGLIDKVMGRESFFNYLADLRNENEGVPKTATSSKLESIGDSKEMSTEEKTQLEELQAQMAEMSAVLESQKSTIELVQSERDSLVKLEAEREATKLSSKLEGYSFTTEGLDAILGGVDEEQRMAVLATLDGAEASLKEAKEAKVAAEDREDADMFLQSGETGEAELLSPKERVQAKVSQLIKQKALKEIV